MLIGVKRGCGALVLTDHYRNHEASLRRFSLRSAEKTPPAGPSLRNALVPPQRKSPSPPVIPLPPQEISIWLHAYHALPDSRCRCDSFFTQGATPAISARQAQGPGRKDPETCAAGLDRRNWLGRHGTEPGKLVSGSRTWRCDRTFRAGWRAASGPVFRTRGDAVAFGEMAFGAGQSGEGGRGAFGSRARERVVFGRTDPSGQRRPSCGAWFERRRQAMRRPRPSTWRTLLLFRERGRGRPSHPAQAMRPRSYAPVT